jgi:hypothetical protein
MDDSRFLVDFKNNRQYAPSFSNSDEFKEYCHAQTVNMANEAHKCGNVSNLEELQGTPELDVQVSCYREYLYGRARLYDGSLNRTTYDYSYGGSVHGTSMLYEDVRFLWTSFCDSFTNWFYVRADPKFFPPILKDYGSTRNDCAGDPKLILAMECETGEPVEFHPDTIEPETID